MTTAGYSPYHPPQIPGSIRMLKNQTRFCAGVPLRHAGFRPRRERSRAGLQDHRIEEIRRPDPQLLTDDAGVVGLRPGGVHAGLRSQDQAAVHHQARRLPHHLLQHGRAIRHARRSAGAFRRRRQDHGRDPAQANDPALDRARRHAVSQQGPQPRFLRRRPDGLGEEAWQSAARLVRRAAHRHVQGLGRQPRALQARSHFRPGRSRPSSFSTSSAA